MDIYQAGRRQTFAFLLLLKKATVVAKTSRSIYFLASVDLLDSFYFYNYTEGTYLQLDSRILCNQPFIDHVINLVWKFRNLVGFRLQFHLNYCILRGRSFRDPKYKARDFVNKI